MKSRAVLLGLLAAGLFSVAGCGGGGTTPAPKKEEKKTSMVTPPANTEAKPADTEGLTLVSINVPNMT